MARPYVFTRPDPSLRFFKGDEPAPRALARSHPKASRQTSAQTSGIRLN